MRFESRSTTCRLSSLAAQLAPQPTRPARAPSLRIMPAVLSATLRGPRAQLGAVPRPRIGDLATVTP